MVLLLSLGSASQLSACEADSPASSVALKSFLQDHLRGKSHTEDMSAQFFAASVSLDDKTPMMLVYVSGQRWCGSGGCTALLLREHASSFEFMQKFTLARRPIRVLCSKTNGWRDIAMWVRGGGITGHAVVLHFDGSRYPSNPSMAPAVSATVFAECGQDLVLGGPGENVYP